MLMNMHMWRNIVWFNYQFILTQLRYAHITAINYDMKTYEQLIITLLFPVRSFNSYFYHSIISILRGIVTFDTLNPFRWHFTMHELLFFIEFYGEWYFINILCYEELHLLDVESSKEYLCQSIYLNRVELSALRFKSHHFFHIWSWNWIVWMNQQ